MEAVLEIELYDKIRGRLSDEGARELIRFVEAKLDNGFEARLDTLATKSDLAALKQELKQDITSLRQELKQDISDLRVEIARTESRLVKWMFIFLIGQAAAIISVIKLL